MQNQYNISLHDSVSNAISKLNTKTQIWGNYTFPSPTHNKSVCTLQDIEIHEKMKDWNQFLLAFSEVATAKRGDGIWCYQLYNTVVLVLVLWTLRYTTRSALYHWQETLKVYYQQRHQTHTLMGQHLQHQAQIFISSIAW